MAVRRLGPVLALGIAFVTAASAVANADRPKIGVLGLEVQTNGATADPESTKIAKWLTQGLRNRATSGRGQYQLAPNSARELIDEKLMKGCENEKPDCMAQIGTDMHSDFLLYGRIDKMIKNDISVFQVTLKLLDVANQKEIGQYKQFVPVNTAKAQDQAMIWAGEAYGAVTHEPITPTPPTVTSKDETKPNRNPAQPQDDANPWKLPAKVGLYTSIGMGLGFIATWGPLALKGKGDHYFTGWGGSCTNTDHSFACDHGEALATGTKVFGIGFLVSATFTGVAYYMSSRSGGKESPTQNSSTGRQKKERTFVVTPVVSPDGAGATMRFDW
jgi:hypothetical protein